MSISLLICPENQAHLPTTLSVKRKSFIDEMIKTSVVGGGLITLQYSVSKIVWVCVSVHNKYVHARAFTVI